MESCKDERAEPSLVRYEGDIQTRSAPVRSPQRNIGGKRKGPPITSRDTGLHHMAPPGCLRESATAEQHVSAEAIDRSDLESA